MKQEQAPPEASQELIERLANRVAELEAENVALRSRGSEGDAERLLRLSQQRYRALAQATSKVVWTFDPATGLGDYSAVQDWWASRSGRTPEEQRSGGYTGWLESIHESDRELVSKKWAAAMDSGSKFDVEYRLCASNGQVFHIRSTAVPMVEEDGAIHEWLGVLEDTTSWRSSEAALLEMTSALGAVIQSSPLAVIAVDAEGKTQIWNPAAEEIFGWTRAEALGSFALSVPDECVEAFTANFRAVMASPEVMTWQTDRRRKDGTRIEVVIWAAALRDADGKATGMVSIIEDRTEAKAAADALSRSQESLALAMRGGKMGHWSRDLVNGHVHWSPELEALFGLATGSFSGEEEAFFRHVHRDDLPDLIHAVQVSIQSGRDYTVEFRFFREDGSMGWMDGRGRTTYDASGKPIRLDGFGIDISDRKTAEAALYESERRFRHFAEAMPVIAWSLNSDRVMDFMNRRFFDLTGTDKTVDLETAWSAVVHPDDYATALPRYTERIAAEMPWLQELRLKMADGSYRWHLSRLEPVRDAHGNVLRWFGTSTDIHDQKEAEASLELRVKQRTQEMTLAIDELEGFTYTVSHDLRAPLRAINATSSILLDELGEDLAQEHRDMLLRQAHNARKLGVLIDELLRLSRINRQEIERATFDMSCMAEEIAEELRSRGWENTPKITVAPGLTATGDEKLVRFVLLNLLENAVKFSPQGAVIDVGRADGAFYVADQGIGFEMEYADKLFLPFERLVSDDAFPGTGVGLANVQRIIQRHGGRVWADSAVGQGSKFWFTLG